MIAVHHFSRRVAPTSGHHFGIDAVLAAASLRALADDVEVGRVVLVDVMLESRAAHDDFVAHSFHIKLHEIVPLEDKEKKP